MKKNKMIVIDTNIGQDVKPFEIEYEYDMPLNQGKVTESTLIYAADEPEAWSLGIMFMNFMEGLIHFIRPVNQED